MQNTFEKEMERFSYQFTIYNYHKTQNIPLKPEQQIFERCLRVLLPQFDKMMAAELGAHSGGAMNGNQTTSLSSVNSFRVITRGSLDTLDKIRSNSWVIVDTIDTDSIDTDGHNVLHF